MKIVIGPPPNIEDIRAVFDLSNQEPIFCWGDIIYNPHNIDVNEFLKVHEHVHSDQQSKTSPAAWWSEYLVDTEFRLRQELPAHRAEYRAFRARHKDRNLHARALHGIAERLSSPLYGSVITLKQAKKEIMK